MIKKLVKHLEKYEGTYALILGIVLVVAIMLIGILLSLAATLENV